MPIGSSPAAPTSKRRAQGSQKPPKVASRGTRPPLYRPPQRRAPKTRRVESPRRAQQAPKTTRQLARKRWLLPTIIAATPTTRSCLLSLPPPALGVRAGAVFAGVQATNYELACAEVQDQALQLGHAALPSTRTSSRIQLSRTSSHDLQPSSGAGLKTSAT